MPTKTPSLRASLPFILAAALLAGAQAQKPKPTVSASGLSVSVSGSPVEFSGAGPVMQGESVLVPFRAVLERLGSTVAYDSASKQIDAATREYKVRLTPGSTAARVNDRDINMAVAPKLIGGTVYIPLRFVSESLGAKVQYDATAKTVQITPKAEPVGSATDTETQAMNETNTTTNQTPANIGNAPTGDANAGSTMGAPNANAANSVGNTDANATNAPTGTTETNGATTTGNSANVAPTGNAPDANATANAPASVTPIRQTAITTPATTDDSTASSSIPWLPILGVLAVLIVAAIVYFALKGRRSGQIIASGSDSKKN